jgi:hypothetical protein
MSPRTFTLAAVVALDGQGMGVGEQRTGLIAGASK